GYAGDWLQNTFDHARLLKLAPGVEELAFNLLRLLLILVFIRFSALAGYHAAEHQAVHTIEAREPLTIDRLRSKPRAHPRCGTNLMVVVALAGMLLDCVWSMRLTDPTSGEALLELVLILLFV